jgi:hypothetical protein
MPDKVMIETAVDESKRRFMKQSLGLIAVSGLVAGGAKEAGAAPPDVPPSMKGPGDGMSQYGSPAKYERKVTRALLRSQPGTTVGCPTSTPTSIGSSSTAW